MNKQADEKLQHGLHAWTVSDPQWIETYPDMVSHMLATLTPDNCQKRLESQYVAFTQQEV